MPPITQQDRITEIDGLRGCAALCVVLAHLCFGMFNEVRPLFLPVTVQHAIEPILDGTLWVAVFYVLSGDALSSSHWQQPSMRALVRLAFKRYFRLAIPVLVSCFITFLLVRLGLICNGPASVVLRDEQWLGSFLQSPWSVWSCLRYALVEVFIWDEPRRSLNPFLLTMSSEVIGSALVFLYLFLDRYVADRISVLLTLFLGLSAADLFLACFPLGMMLGVVRARGGFALLQRHSATTPAAVVSTFAAMLAGTYGNQKYPGWNLIPIGASFALTTGFYASSWFRTLLQAPMCLWLGRISFPLYLTHFTVMVTLTSWAVVWIDGWHLLGAVTIWTIIAGSVACSAVVAVLFEPVEHLTGWVSERIYRIAVKAGTAKQCLPSNIDNGRP